MANYWYWYWHRHLHAVVLPELKRLYEFQEHRVVPTMARRGETVPAPAEPTDDALRVPYADAVAVIERLRKDAVVEQFGVVSAVAVYTNATCQALYLEASKFLLLLHRKEILSASEDGRSALPALGDLPSAFAARGVDLKQLDGFEAYDLLRLVAHDHEHMPGDADTPLQRRRPKWVNPNPLGWRVVLIEPHEVTWLYDGLCRFLGQVVEAFQGLS